MNYNTIIIDFLAESLMHGYNEPQAMSLLCELGVAIDAAKTEGKDTAELQHSHDVLLNLISTL